MKARLFDDLFVEVDPRVEQLHGSFLNGEAYCPTPLRWCYEQIRSHERPVLIDGGACTGSYTLLAAHIPDLIVHAFEPVPETMDVLGENVHLNRLEKRVNCFLIALAGSGDDQVLHVAEPPHLIALSWVGGLRPPDGEQPFHTRRTDCLTIDGFCEPAQIIPTLIKLDIQGMELAALHGAERTIAAHHPALCVEYCPTTCAQYGYNPEEIGALLAAWNYEVALVEQNDYLATWKGKV